jgi:enamine deaminase RidA (YjgF/YER057c/UK114 family)
MQAPDTPTSSASTVTPLLPVTIQPGNVRYAPGVRAGRWVFATGHKGTADFGGPMAADVLDSIAPRRTVPRSKKEAQRIFANLDRVLNAGGTRREHAVRIDQYYRAAHAVDPYHEVRREFFKGAVPASTSNLHQEFLLAGQDIEVQLIAAIPGRQFEVQQHRPADLPVHASSGYSPVLTCGDYVFVAGQTAEAFKIEEGPLEPSARMPAGHLWKGTPIKLETQFIVERKLKPALAMAGSTLGDVLKAQVYLRDLDDIPAFNEVWKEQFGNAPPATTIINTSTPGFICESGRIEINTISFRGSARTKPERIRAGVAMPFAGQVEAVRAGDLLFMGGLMAVDATGGLSADVRSDPLKPYFGRAIQRQMDHVLTQAERICSIAGTSLANVVRVQQFHTDLRDFQGAYEVWVQHQPQLYLPFSAIEVPGLAVPGAVVMLDLWVYAP